MDLPWLVECVEISWNKVHNILLAFIMFGVYIESTDIWSQPSLVFFAAGHRGSPIKAIGLKSQAIDLSWFIMIYPNNRFLQEWGILGYSNLHPFGGNDDQPSKSGFHVFRLQVHHEEAMKEALRLDGQDSGWPFKFWIPNQQKARKRLTGLCWADTDTGVPR